MDEVDMTSITNEGLAIEIKNLSIQIADLKAQLALSATNYVRNDVFELRMREYDKQIAAIELQIATVKKEATKASWKSHTLTAAFSIFITLMITYVFNDILKR